MQVPMALQKIVRASVLRRWWDRSAKLILMSITCPEGRRPSALRRREVDQDEATSPRSVLRVAWGIYRAARLSRCRLLALLRGEGRAAGWHGCRSV